MPVHNRYFLKDNGQPSPEGLRRHGPFFEVAVQVPRATADVLAKQGQPLPTPQTGRGVVDTGASLTCVHEPVLQALGIHPIGQVTTGTAGGPSIRNVYPAQLELQDAGIRIELTRVAGVDLTGQGVGPGTGQPLIALLGRNLLERMLLVYNGPGGYWTLAL